MRIFLNEIATIEKYKSVPTVFILIRSVVKMYVTCQQRVIHMSRKIHVFQQMHIRCLQRAQLSYI